MLPLPYGHLSAWLRPTSSMSCDRALLTASPHVISSVFCALMRFTAKTVTFVLSFHSSYEAIHIRAFATFLTDDGIFIGRPFLIGFSPLPRRIRRDIARRHPPILLGLDLRAA